MLVDDTPASEIDGPVLRVGPRPVLELTGEATPIRSLSRDLWRHRGLIPMMSAKDFNSRYRSASFGVLWSVLLPLLQGIVIAIVFSRFFKLRAGRGDDFKLFVLSGTLTWAYISGAIGQGSTSVVDQGGVAGKVYFPRLILPIVPAVTNVISLVISYCVLMGLMVSFQSPFHLTLLWLPPCILLLAALALTFSAVTAIGHVYFRDVKYIVNAALTLLFYATPLLYPLSRLPASLRGVIIANPATGPIQLVHYAVFGHADNLGRSLEWTGGWIVLMTVLTMVIYRRYERVACDRL